MSLQPIPQFDGLEWELYDEERPAWHLIDRGRELIAECYAVAYGGPDLVRWHCKTSDVRERAPDFDAAKLRCVVSHVKHLMYRYALERSEAVSN